MTLELYGRIVHTVPDQTNDLKLAQSFEFDFDVKKMMTKWFDDEVLPDVTQLIDTTKISGKIAAFYNLFGQKLFKESELEPLKRAVLIYLDFDGYINIKGKEITTGKKMPKDEEHLDGLVIMSCFIYGMLWYNSAYIRDGKLMVPMNYVQEKAYLEIFENKPIAL